MKSIIPRPTKFTRAPKYPISGQQITIALKQSLDSVEMPAGQSLQQKRFGQLLGIPKSTIHEWFHSDQIKPVQRFLSGLERLSEFDRLQLLRKLCRPCPRLTSSRITVDPDLLNGLLSSIKIRQGITFVLGASDDARTYLVTAIGNSLAAELEIAGFDRHPPLNFVPIPGVHYPDQVPTAQEICTFLTRLAQSGGRADLIVLNGVWREALSHRPSIFKLATNHHLLIADDIETAEIPFASVPIQIVRVEEGKDANGKSSLQLNWTLHSAGRRRG